MCESVPAVGGVITADIQDAFRHMEIRARHAEFNARVLGDLIDALDQRFGFDDEMWRTVVAAVCEGNDRDAYEVQDVLTTFCGVEESVFMREFVVDVTLPVYFSMTVYAPHEDEADEVARNELGNMWASEILASYDIDADSSEITINNVSEA